MTAEKARQDWISTYRLFGKGKAELEAYQNYIALSQGKKQKKRRKIKFDCVQGTATLF